MPDEISSPSNEDAPSTHDAHEANTALVLTDRTKLALMAGLLMLIAAVYFYFVPIHLPTQTGTFGCGSASSPPTDEFGKGVCRDIPNVNLFRAYALGAAGILTAVLGHFFFGDRGSVKAHAE